MSDSSLSGVNYVQIGRWMKCAHCGCIIENGMTHYCGAPWQIPPTDVPKEWLPMQPFSPASDTPSRVSPSATVALNPKELAHRAVQRLADSEPTEDSIEGMERLRGTPQESMFVVNAAELVRVIECTLEDALYDASRSPSSPAPSSETPCNSERVLCEGTTKQTEESWDGEPKTIEHGVDGRAGGNTPQSDTPAPSAGKSHAATAAQPRTNAPATSVPVSRGSQSSTGESLSASASAISPPPDQGCKLPPEGWYCSRSPGHEGPCAARPLPSRGSEEELGKLLDDLENNAHNQGFAQDAIEYDDVIDACDEHWKSERDKFREATKAARQSVESYVSQLLDERDRLTREIAEAREILAGGLDRDRSDCRGASLRNLATLAINGIFWRDKEIIGLRAALASLKEDAVRLDWLDEQQHFSVGLNPHDGIQSAHDGMGRVILRLWHKSRGGENQSLR